MMASGIKDLKYSLIALAKEIDDTAGKFATQAQSLNSLGTVTSALLEQTTQNVKETACNSIADARQSSLDAAAVLIEASKEIKNYAAWL